MGAHLLGRGHHRVHRLLLQPLAVRRVRLQVEALGKLRDTGEPLRTDAARRALDGMERKLPVLRAGGCAQMRKIVRELVGKELENLTLEGVRLLWEQAGGR